jgi:hypothetical protein|tara:strand:+ start:103 stop:363 length:261 start_codon:yes stop_codon:yes gene_type:complete
MEMGPKETPGEVDMLEVALLELARRAASATNRDAWSASDARASINTRHHARASTFGALARCGRSSRCEAWANARVSLGYKWFVFGG